ncbi:hypothetical protein C0993_008517 [Termitomyces sp. T159_Od127]|nr:hypothetical protein C0993_008517 [Termitomyces sp. T159_Od127]
MATGSDRFRIAVALTALRFKPLDQSFTAYALELRSQFPSISAELDSVDCWRSLALKLERDVEVLKEKYEAEQIRTLALESGMTPGSSLPASNSSLEKSTVSKKKSKKKPGANTISCSEDTMRKLPIPRPDLKAILEDLSSRKEGDVPISWIQSQQSLFSTLDSFMQLVALSEARMDLLSSVTLRTVKAIAKQIDDVISPLVPSASSDPETLNSLGTTLHYVLATSLPLLEQALPETAETIIAIVDRTTRLILLPIVHAFNVRSEAFLRSLFMPRPARPPDQVSEQSATCHRSLSTDIRVNMLDMFKTTFCFLDGRLRSFTTLIDPSLVSHTFRASLILDVLRELDGVLSVVPMATPFHDSESGVEMINEKHCRRTRLDRVKRLAKKDSLWYLCTVLHVLLSEASSAAASPLETVSVGRKDAQKEYTDNLQGARLLSEGILDALHRLITRCHRPLSSSVKSQELVDSDEQRGHAGSGLTLKHVCLQGGAGFASKTAGPRDRADANADSCVSLLGENRGGDVDVVIDATKRHRNEDRSLDLLPQEAESHNGHDSKIELDEVSYGMLLGVLERYWIWSRSWEI